MAGSKVPRDPNLSPELRRFLDELSRLSDELNAADNAPADASYVTLGTSATLSNERVLTAGSDISLTDAGAGSTLTVAYTGTAGLTFVGTVVTTSGATASITDLPSAKMFMIQYYGVSHNDGGGSQGLRVALSVNNGSSYGTAHSISPLFGNATAVYGIAFVGNADGGASHPVTQGGSSGGLDTTSGAIDALQFSPSGGSFDAGAIDIYALN